MNKIPDCQDWTQVVFKKKPNTVGHPPVHASAGSRSLENVGVYAAASDDGVKTIKYVAKATSDAIRTARCEKKFTQKELAQKCNMDASIISEIERGGCVYNPVHVNKIQTVLGSKIPRV